MDYLLLGRRIKEERTKRGLTQHVLAEAVHVTDAYIGQIERGARHLTLDTLVDIANIFHVSVDFLLWDSVKHEDKELYDEWASLYSPRSEREKRMLIDMTRVLLGHLDHMK